MEILAFIAAACVIGGILGFLLLRRRKPRRHDFLENPNEWGW